MSVEQPAPVADGQATRFRKCLNALTDNAPRQQAGVVSFAGSRLSHRITIRLLIVFILLALAPSTLFVWHSLEKADNSQATVFATNSGSEHYIIPILLAAVIVFVAFRMGIRLLRPIRRLIKAEEQFIEGGQEAAQIAEDQISNDEVGDLMRRRNAAIRQIMAAEERQRRLVDDVDAIVWEAEAGSWHYTYVSHRAENMLGYPVSQWLTEPDFWVRHIHPADRSQVVRTRLIEVIAGRDHQIEYRLIAAGDRIVWVRDFVRLVENSQGPDGQLRGVMIDITASKRAAEELHESHRFLQSSLDALSAHIAILDEKGTITAVNAAWRRFAKANQCGGTDGGVGTSHLEVCKICSQIEAPEAAQMAQGIREVMMRQRSEFQMEYPCHSSGENRWFHLRVTRFEGRGPVRVVVAHEDITERKRAEAENQRASSLLRATLESTADGILVVGSDGHIAIFNKRFADMWRIPTEVLASGDDARALAFVLDQLVVPQQFLAKVQELYSHPDAESWDVLDFKDGRVFERYSLPQRLDGKSVGRVWSFRNVTQQATLSPKTNARIAHAREEAHPVC